MDKTADNKDWMHVLKMANSIHNATIRKLTCGFLQEVVPDYFAAVPASSTGKYHPKTSNGYAGLCRHTIAVARIAQTLASIQFLRYNMWEQDLFLAAALLHDTFKQGNPCTGNTVRNHPVLASEALLSYAKSLEDTAVDERERKQIQEAATLISQLIVSHMGEWSSHNVRNRQQLLIHAADMLASRKWLLVSDEGLDEIEEQRG